ncbi:5'-methylthioadenosine/S-adenosylhomocysteine nucleosidase family protein [Flavobacterium cerinum]|uniref:Nucleosidase n=1 Tax=Flavobacterium cerinum TaxID=2502784 RepID=A0ABY5IQT5_9FLAO|nr:nucleosidase [Flavobacterium cerinum]UUC45211.1 nucleosidase [Flavobacterium cerinum]
MNPEQKKLQELINENPLYVFALNSEAGEEFQNENTLFVGIGKVNTAYHLTKAIQTNRPGLIINLGSAGSTTFKKGSVICCTRFIQRDMDVRGLGFELYQTPLSNEEIVLSYGLSVPGLEEGICGTGDNFETNHTATDYTVVDMEAYAIALIAKQENIPFLCLKYISDGADGAAADDWTVQVHNAAVAFKNVLNGITIEEKQIQ